MLGENIKIARKNKGLTQEELALKLNVVRQTVSKWEKNLSVPDADLLEKLAETLDTDVYILLGCEPIEQKDDTHKKGLDAVAEQLSRINEQEAAKIRSIKKIWRAIGIILLAVIFLCIVWYVFGRAVTINENVT